MQFRQRQLGSFHDIRTTGATFRGSEIKHRKVVKSPVSSSPAVSKTPAPRKLASAPAPRMNPFITLEEKDRMNGLMKLL